MIAQAVARVVAEIGIDKAAAGGFGDLQESLNGALAERDLFAREDDEQVIARRRRQQFIHAAPAQKVAKDAS